MKQNSHIQNKNRNSKISEETKKKTPLHKGSDPLAADLDWSWVLDPKRPRGFGWSRGAGPANATAPVNAHAVPAYATASTAGTAAAATAVDSAAARLEGRQCHGPGRKLGGRQRARVEAEAQGRAAAAGCCAAAGASAAAAIASAALARQRPLLLPLLQRRGSQRRPGREQRTLVRRWRATATAAQNATSAASTGRSSASTSGRGRRRLRRTLRAAVLAAVAARGSRAALVDAPTDERTGRQGRGGPSGGAGVKARVRAGGGPEAIADRARRRVLRVLRVLLWRDRRWRGAGPPLRAGGEERGSQGLRGRAEGRQRHHDPALAGPGGGVAQVHRGHMCTVRTVRTVRAAARCEA